MTRNEIPQGDTGVVQLGIEIKGNVYRMRNMVVFIHQLGFSQRRT